MWVIERDLETREGDETDAVKTMGGLSLGDDGKGRVRFRLYDGDDILYYEGQLDDDDRCENQLDALEWGKGYAGCTTIKVKRMYREVITDTVAHEWKQEIG